MQSAGKETVLVVGEGGRECAIAWKLSQSPKVETVLVAKGNVGTTLLPKTRNVDSDDVVAIAKQHKVSLVVIGPEAPLAAGIADKLKHAGIPCFGPSQKAAAIEASKVCTDCNLV